MNEAISVLYIYTHRSDSEDFCGYIGGIVGIRSNSVKRCDERGERAPEQYIQGSCDANECQLPPWKLCPDPVEWSAAFNLGLLDRSNASTIGLSHEVTANTVTLKRLVALR